MKNCVWFRDWSLGFTESGLLRGHESEVKISSIGGYFQGSRSGREFVYGEGEFAGEERRKASDRTAGGKKGLSMGFVVSFDDAFRGSTVKAVKGWWVPVCHLAYAQAGVEHSTQMI